MSWTLAVVVLLLYLVFVVDPVIYLVRMPEVRRVMYRGVQWILRCGRGCQQDESGGYRAVATKHCVKERVVKTSTLSNATIPNTSSSVDQR